MKFLEDYTKEELATHLNRYVKTEYHDEYGNQIISREQYEADKAETERRFKDRILKENRQRYEEGRSVANEPKLFAGCSLEDYSIDKYPDGFVERMKERADKGESHYLLGEFGSGKSRFLWAYAKYLFLEKGYRSIEIVRFNDIFKELTFEYGNYGGTEYFEKLKKCSTLLIDDVRVMSGKQVKEYDFIVDLLDARLENNLTTCFTSNVDYANLCGDDNSSRRVASRIERILKSSDNLELFEEKFYEF